MRSIHPLPTPSLPPTPPPSTSHIHHTHTHIHSLPYLVPRSRLKGSSAGFQCSGTQTQAAASATLHEPFTVSEALKQSAKLKKLGDHHRHSQHMARPQYMRPSIYRVFLCESKCLLCRWYALATRNIDKRH